ncbi:DNA-formamidopyrimidine glycosylase family protein [Lentzea sp. CC55]|uniref:DNA-formamidopyrimidine glycosylase family protein n=1 Tax=Lentzea sp. CC55 TaxID=2884909 RepID=UPI001F30A819|nr:DNA-formamidopyrimidine glycosylase family protein [Lentzea sp. CC55]MCG8925083.1 DNA glycosylase [Lentzea sp. CC55]
MAEGDSVARIAARLDTATAGSLIVHSDVRHPRFATVDLAGQRILEWRARGKHLLSRTDTGLTVHSHLGMTGSWSVLRPHKRLPARVVPDLRMALRLDDGRTLVGVALPVLTVLRTRDEHTVVGHLGPDLLGADTTGVDSIIVAAERVAAAGDETIVAALLDQRRVAGLGNMWAQELLFLHRVSPWRAAGTVDDLEVVLTDARRRLEHAVRANPAQNTTGMPRPRHWVYGRARRPCLRCGTPIAFRPAERTSHGRETWWCPVCQV